MTVEKPSAKTEQKRRSILRVALKIFAKEGFRNTDVQVIADLSKVGKGTVYRHFGNKEQLFLATSKYCSEMMGEYLRERVAQTEDTAEVLRAIGLTFAEFYQKHPQCIEILVQERAEFRDSVFPTHLMYRSETRGEFDEFLRMAMMKGELRNLNATDATNVFGDLLYGSVINGCLEGKKRSLVKRVEQAVDIYLNGTLASGASTTKTTKKQTKSRSNK